MPDDVTDAMEDAAQRPLRVVGDEGEVEAHRLGDVIAADRYLSAKAAMGVKSRGLRFNRLVLPSATGGTSA